MYVFITVLILIAAVCLILIVLVQNSKGGGLASSFASSNQIMGAPKTADFLEKATWTLAGIVIVLSIVAAAFMPNRNIGPTSVIKDDIHPQILTPNFETQVPVTPEAPAVGEDAAQ